MPNSGERETIDPGHPRPRSRHFRESRYLLGWGSLMGVLAISVGCFLFVLVSSMEGSASGEVPGISQLAAPPGRPPSQGASAPGSATAPPPTDAPKGDPAKPERPVQPPPRFRGIEIKSPTERQGVHGAEGILITGTAGPFEKQALRVFDLADNGLYYLVDVGPIAVQDGYWSLRYRHIGDGQTDIGRVFTMTAVLADASCERALDSAKPNHEGDRPFPQLPAGCRIMDQVKVVKIGP